VKKVMTMKKMLYCLLLSAGFTTKVLPQVNQLANNEGLEMLGLLNSNKAVFYSKKTNKLWVSDGTVAGTTTFTNKVSIPALPVSTVMNGLLFFTGTDAVSGTELWVTDGTDAGTTLVKDINSGAAGSAPADRFVVLDNQVFFSATTAASGRELWKSDGTAAGTVMIKDIVPGALGSNQDGLYKMTAAGSYVYFICNTPGEGEELWRTDGSSAGTILLKDIKPGNASSTPIMLGTYKSKLIFNAEDLLHGREPWISDGTPAGTNMIKDIATGPLSSSADNFIAFNDKMLFAALDITNGQELWETDGTDAGTTLLKDIEPGNIGSAPVLYNAIKAGNKLFFTAFTLDNGLELWSTDGTTAGTQLFKDIEPGQVDGMPILLPAYANGFGPSSQLFQGNKFFFAAFTLASGYELYISDGTLTGTSMVKNLDNDIEDGFTASGYYITASAIYFSGNDGTHRGELFKSDGTASGTVLAAAVNTAGTNAETTPFVIIGNGLLFFGNDGNNPTTDLNDLYRLTTNDVVLPVNIISFSGKNESSKNILVWKAANGINFSHFVIERSSDGSNFTEIGNTPWGGNGNYSFTDDNLPLSSKIHYYRLKLVDSNDDLKYSNTIILKNATNTTVDFKAVRNGSSMSVNYHLGGNGGYIRIADMQGSILHSSRLVNSSGYINITVPPAAQVLIISVVEGSNVVTKKVF
jgi:ELWxxDGT repeat protein